MAVARQHDVLSSRVHLGLLYPALGFAVSLLWDQYEWPPPTTPSTRAASWATRVPQTLESWISQASPACCRVSNFRRFSGPLVKDGLVETPRVRHRKRIYRLWSWLAVLTKLPTAAIFTIALILARSCTHVAAGYVLYGRRWELLCKFIPRGPRIPERSRMWWYMEVAGFRSWLSEDGFHVSPAVKAREDGSDYKRCVEEGLERSET